MPDRHCGLLRVPFLDQQPILGVLAGLRLQTHQHERAAQPVSVQAELYLAAVQVGLRIGAQRGPVSPAPQLDGAGAVVARGNAALELRVVERMVLHMHRQTLVLAVHRRALGHRPAPQHAAMLQPEIPVQPSRGMLLDHEYWPVLAVFTHGPVTRRLRRAGKITLLRVGAGLRGAGRSGLLGPGSGHDVVATWVLLAGCGSLL